MKNEIVFRDNLKTCNVKRQNKLTLVLLIAIKN